MGFRAVDKSSFILETDIPPSSRNIHPSGVLHATRSFPTKSGAGVCVEQVFAWIHNTLYIDSALDRLEKQGFDRSRGIVFIPYSSKNNWLDRYPQAVLAMESVANGEVVVGEIRQHPETDEVAAATEVKAMAKAFGNDREYEGGEGSTWDETRKDKYFRKYENLVQDQKCLLGSERDELHGEIYKYFLWLRSRLTRVEKGAAADASLPAHAAPAPEKDAPVKETSVDEAHGNLATEGEVVVGLGAVLKSLEGAFPIVLNIKQEVEDAEEEGEGNQKPARKEEMDVPLLEERLRTMLTESVAASEQVGKGEHSRKRRRKTNDGLFRVMSSDERWENNFAKLVEYYNVEGHCNIKKSDHKIGRWVHNQRHAYMALQKGKQSMSLTPDRIAKLEAIGFQWRIKDSREKAWDNKFKLLEEFHKEHGHVLVPRNAKSLGRWVSTQRGQYKKKNKGLNSSISDDQISKLESIGFTWIVGPSPKKKSVSEANAAMSSVRATTAISGDLDISNVDQV